MHLVKMNTRVGLPALVVASVLLFAVAPASAQIPGAFVIDHQFSYKLQEPVTGNAVVFLRDQFVEVDHEVLLMERFSLPVDKNGEGILHPDWHYTWWRLLGNLENPFPSVIVRNQFGEQSLDVGNAAYLLTPALKNQAAPGRPAETGVQGQTNGGIADHYKCYDASGNPLLKDVVLSHQFGIHTGQVLEPRYLCNPVHKTHAGVEYPVAYPDEHLVCYQVLPGAAGVPFLVEVSDQFRSSLIELSIADLLCVPSEKEIPTQVSEESWGKVKAIYR